MNGLTIVIPVYNGSRYIAHCMADLKGQTFQDWEAIFVNDGSSDDSGELLERMARQDERFHVVHQQNGGTARARNAGLAQARGEYITFMDVDDELAPEMYAKLVRLMDDTQADMGACGYYFKIENAEGESSYLEPMTYPSCVLRGREQIRRNLVELWDKDMLSNVWNKIYRMDLIREKDLRYRDGHVYTEDRVFNRQFLENCQSIAVTDECLYYYVRERVGSTSEKYRDDLFTIRDKEYREFQTHFRNMGVWDEKAREYVSREFIERIAGCIENIFHAEGKLTEAQKRARIAEILRHPDVREAAKYARCRSLMMRILAWPIKMRLVPVIYVFYKLVYQVHQSKPELFHKLKNQR